MMPHVQRLIAVFYKFAFNLTHRLAVADARENKVHARWLDRSFIDLHVVFSVGADQEHVDIQSLFLDSRSRICPA